MKKYLLHKTYEGFQILSFRVSHFKIYQSPKLIVRYIYKLYIYATLEVPLWINIWQAPTAIVSLSLFVVYKDLCHAIKDIGEKEATYEEQRRHMSVSSFDNILRRRASGLLICLQVLK